MPAMKLKFIFVRPVFVIYTRNAGYIHSTALYCIVQVSKLGTKVWPLFGHYYLPFRTTARASLTLRAGTIDGGQ